MYKRNLVILFTAISLMGNAQRFHWEAPLAPVSTDAFYKILLQPEVTSQMRTGFPDARIYDKDNNETPYLVFKDEARKGVDRFITYQIVEKNYRNSDSYITVKNALGNSIDHIVLEVNNADANRKMGLTGSYDGLQYFAVKDQYAVVSFNGYYDGQHKTTNLIRFDFPLTDYKFYRFEFDDWHWWWRNFKAPIFVARAGYVEPTFIPQECIELPQARITSETDPKKKQSIIHITFDEPQYIDHLTFGVTRSKDEISDYYRAASLYERILKKGDSLHPYTDRFIASTILSSLNSNEISPGHTKVKELVLVINNEDDRPLNISSVKGYQVKHYFVSKLSSENNYVLRFGSDSIDSPVYDLKYFADKIPDSVKVITTEARKDIFLHPVVKSVVTASFFKSTAFIWTAISIVILLLAVVSSRMLKEMKK